MKDELDGLLDELRRHHREVDAPAHLEPILRAATRAHARRRRLPGTAAALALAATLVMAVVIATTGRAGRGAPSSSGAEFVSLPGAESLPEPAQTTILRVQLIKNDLVLYGIKTSPGNAANPVEAELIVGDDGLARAVRLVQ